MSMDMEAEVKRLNKKVAMLLMRLKKYGEDPSTVMKEIERKV